MWSPFINDGSTIRPHHMVLSVFTTLVFGNVFWISSANELVLLNSGTKQGGMPLLKSKGLAMLTNNLFSKFFSVANFNASKEFNPFVVFKTMSAN